MPAKRSPLTSLRRMVARFVISVFGPVHHGIHERMLARSRRLLEHGHTPSARRWATWATNVRATDTEARLLIARIEAREGNGLAVVEACDEVLRRDPSDPRARVLRAIALAYLEGFEDTEGAATREIPDDPDKVPSDMRGNVGRVLADMEYWPEVLSLSGDSTEPDILELKLRALEALERFDEISQVMADADQLLRPTRRAQIWYSLNIRRDRLSRAWWWLQQIPDYDLELAMSVDAAKRLREAGYTRWATECLERSREILDALPQPSAEWRRLLVKATRQSLALRLPEPAEEFARALAKSFPEYPWSWLWLGRALRAGGKLSEARRALESALALREDLVQAWEELGRVLKDLNVSGEDTIEANRQLLERGRDRPRVAVNAATALLELGEHDHARQALEELADAFPDDPDVEVARVRLLEAQGGQTEAASALSALKLRTDVPGRIAAFRLLLAQELHAEAASLFLELPADAARLTEIRRLASRLRQMGELTQASRVLEHACSSLKDPQLDRLFAMTKRELDALTGRSVPHLRRVGAMTPTRGRVLHVVGKSVPQFSSGYTIRTKYLVEAQRKIGIDSFVVTEPGFPWSVGIEQAAIEEVVDGVTYIRCPTVNGETGADIDRMADIVRRVRPAVLHAASDFRNAVNAFALGRAFGLPVIYEVRGIWEETWVSKRGNEAREREHFRLRKERETESARAADRVVTLSETLRAELISRGIEGDKITVVPNAVDADRFPVQERDHSLAAQWEIEPEEVTVGYISSLVSYEGVEYLIEAVADLRARGRRIRVLVVGDGDQRENLEKHANDLGLEDGLVFTGRVPHSEILGYYGLIDIFVVPRTSARVCQLVTPLKPYEAMATGRAIVVSGVDALREIVEDGVTGLVFKPESSTDLAEAIDTLIEDPAMRARLGANAASAVRQVHTWAANAKLYRDLYRDMGAL